MKELASLLDVTTGESGFRLARLCGEPLAAGGPAAAQGVAVLTTTAGRYEADKLELADWRQSSDGVEARLCTGDSGLEWHADCEKEVKARILDEFVAVWTAILKHLIIAI